MPSWQHMHMSPKLSKVHRQPPFPGPIIADKVWRVSPRSQTSSVRSTASWKDALHSESGKPPIVALGKFDALHVGHRSLAIQAAQMGGTAWLVSFSGMAEVLGWPSRAPLVADCQREAILQSWAPLCKDIAPQYRALPFSAVRGMQPEEFVTLLAKDLKAHGVVVGKGYRFGYKQAGDAEMLRDLGRSMGMTVNIIDLVGAKTPGIVGHASSSEVRQALQQGKLKKVQHLLGRPYTLTAFLPLLDNGNTLRIQRASFRNQVPMIGSYTATYSLHVSGLQQAHGCSAIEITADNVDVLRFDSSGDVQGFDLRLDLTFNVGDIN